MITTQTQDIFRHMFPLRCAVCDLQAACTRLKDAVLADTKRVIFTIRLLFVK